VVVLPLLSPARAQKQAFSRNFTIGQGRKLRIEQRIEKGKGPHDDKNNEDQK